MEEGIKQAMSKLASVTGKTLLPSELNEIFNCFVIAMYEKYDLGTKRHMFDEKLIKTLS